MFSPHDHRFCGFAGPRVHYANDANLINVWVATHNGFNVGWLDFKSGRTDNAFEAVELIKITVFTHIPLISGTKIEHAVNYYEHLFCLFWPLPLAGKSRGPASRTSPTSLAAGCAALGADQTQTYTSNTRIPRRCGRVSST